MKKSPSVFYILEHAEETLEGYKNNYKSTYLIIGWW